MATYKASVRKAGETRGRRPKHETSTVKPLERPVKLPGMVSAKEAFDQLSVKEQEQVIKGSIKRTRAWNRFAKEPMTQEEKEKRKREKEKERRLRMSFFND